MPLLSVIMPAYNSERYLTPAVKSILAQTFTDFELIIVDDASTDQTPDIIHRFAQRDHRVRSLEQPANLGMSAARNRGIEASTGKYIAAMDSDDVSLPERFAKQIDYLHSNPEIGVLGTGALAVDEGLNPMHPFDLPEKHSLIAINLFIASFLIHPTTMTSRALLESVGAYQPSLRTAGDTELWSRLLYRTRFANLTETLLLYRRHAGQQHTNRNDRMKRQATEVRASLLQRLWGEAPPEVLLRFERMRHDEKLTWRQRARASVDLTRLMETMIANDLIDASDRELVTAHIQRRVEATTPRLWQKLRHWFRYRIQRHIS